MTNISKVAIIGSGTMGAQIAAQFANIGVEVLLLDIVLPDEKDRSVLAKKAIKGLLSSKAVMGEDELGLIIPGNLEDDLDQLEKVDLVIEAVVERLDIKGDVFSKIIPYLKSECLIATNTSGIPIEEISNTIPANKRDYFLGIHFFNPPRFMHLVELIPTSYTNTDVVDTLKSFLETKLGKGIIIAKDTPNFVANRMGIVATLSAMRDAQDTEWNPRDIDSLLGSLIGRAKAGVFSLGDIVGLDIVHAVAKNGRTIPYEQEYFEEPEYLTTMLEQGLLGRKTNQGFYKRTPAEDSQLDLRTLTYVPKKTNEGVQAYIKDMKKYTLKERILMIMESNDPYSQYIWKNISDVFIFAVHSIPFATDDYVDIDHAMRWGFNWEIGPFELWDLVGLENVYNKLVKMNHILPDWLVERVENGIPFYDKEKNTQEKLITVKKNRNWMLEKNDDNILTFTITSRNGIISSDVSQGLQEALSYLEMSEHVGMVIESRNENFSLGANLLEMQRLVAEHDFSEIDKQVSTLQQANLALKYATKPVVTLVQGMALGGGCEIVMHSPFVVAHVETYLGLVEVGVGLIPAGGGTTELALRSLSQYKVTKNHKDYSDIKGKVFQIGQGQTSNNAYEAQRIGYLKKTDTIMFNQKNMKDVAYHIIKTKILEGYMPQKRVTVQVPGEAAYYNIQYDIKAMRDGQFISEYDEQIVTQLASIMVGSDYQAFASVSEQELLNDERKNFITLLQNEKTQERIAYMLKTGKPLRN